MNTLLNIWKTGYLFMVRDAVIRIFIWQIGSKTFAAISALLASNEGRLMVLNREKGELAEYKGKAATRFNLTSKKIIV